MANYSLKIGFGEAPLGWDTGSDVGTLVGTLWTPGLGPNSRVNQASINTLPLSTESSVSWVEVAGSRLDSLNSDVLENQPGWSSLGTGDPWNSVLSNYNGMAWDTRPGTERGWVMNGGGHFGGSNDGIYGLDCRKLSWFVQQYPANQTYFDPDYKLPNIYTTTNSFTNYTLSSNYYSSNPSNSEGVYNDEFFDPTHPTDLNYSPRTPTARHQYQGVVFVPELGTSGKLLTGTRRYWQYDIENQSYATPKFPFDTQATYGFWYSGQYCMGFWDSVEQRYYFGPTQEPVSNGGHVFWSCAADGTDWNDEGYYPYGGSNAEFMGLQIIDRTCWLLIFDNDVNNRTTKPLQMREVDMDSKSTTTHTITLGTSLNTKTFPQYDYDFGPGLTWVPWVNKWLFNLRTVETGYAWAWLDPTTWTADLVTEFSGATVAPNQRILNKYITLEDAGILLQVTAGDQNIRIARFV